MLILSAFAGRHLDGTLRARRALRGRASGRFRAAARRRACRGRWWLSGGGANESTVTTSGSRSLILVSASRARGSSSASRAGALRRAWAWSVKSAFGVGARRRRSARHAWPADLSSSASRARPRGIRKGPRGRARDLSTRVSARVARRPRASRVHSDGSARLLPSPSRSFPS